MAIRLHDQTRVLMIVTATIFLLGKTASADILSLQISPPVAEQVIRAMAIGSYVARNADVKMSEEPDGIRASFYFVSIEARSAGNTGPIFEDEPSSTLRSSNLTVQQLRDVATALDVFACGEFGSYCDRLVDTTEQGMSGIIWKIAFRLNETSTVALEQELLQAIALVCAVPDITGCEFDHQTFIVPNRPYGNPPIREVPIHPSHAKLIVHALEYMCSTYATDCFYEAGYGTNGEYGTQFTLFRTTSPSVVFVYDARYLTIQRMETGTLDSYFSHCISFECIQFRRAFEDARNAARQAGEWNQIGEHILVSLQNNICSDIPNLSGVCDGSFVPSTPCHLFNSGDSIPEGYATPYNVLSPEQEMLVEASCSDSEAFITVGNGSPLQTVWREGYYWKNDGWNPFPVTCDAAQSGDWCIGGAHAYVPRDGLLQLHAVMFFICTEIDGVVKCGCRDQACMGDTEMLWNFQAYFFMP